MSPRVKEPNAGANRPGDQEAGAGGAGGWGGLPRSPRRGNPGKSFPEDAGHGGRGSAGDSCTTSGSGAGSRDPEAAEQGGSGQREASCHPSAARCAPSSPRPCIPTLPPRRDVPNTCFQFSPSSPELPGPRGPRNAQGTRGPVTFGIPILWWPSWLPRAGLGGTITACQQMRRVPFRGTVVPLPRSNPSVQQPRPQQSRAGGVGPPHPGRHFPPDPCCPESLWMQIVRGRELPIARPRQIAG